MSTPVLSVKDLSITFTHDRREVEAVRGISFDVHAGEVVALVGESGSGKSVTARALLGLGARGQRISGGSVELAGPDGTVDLTTLTPKQLRRQGDVDAVALQTGRRRRCPAVGQHAQRCSLRSKVGFEQGEILGDALRLPQRMRVQRIHVSSANTLQHSDLASKHRIASAF